MGKILNHGNWKKERGFTLVEIVITIAVISIVSIATVSLAVYSTNSLVRSRERSFFSRETYNYSQLYLSYNERDFYNAVNVTTGSSESNTYHNFMIGYDHEYKYVALADKSYYVSFEFSNENKTLTMNAYNSKDVSIYSRSVSK